MRTYKVWPGAMIALATWMGCTAIACVDGAYQHDNDGASGTSGSGATGGAGGTGSVCAEGAIEDCYEGPEGSQNIGICAAGTRSCVSGQWGACENQILPSEDVCNGLDDDCDDTADEEIPSITCGVGACTVTVEGCKDGVVQECVPLEPSANEICEGTDDDCDGQVDEGCSCINGETQNCYTGSTETRNVGVCVDGTQSCIDGIWGGCEGEVVPESQETCDGLDNDCDKSVDEELAPIICGVGACQTIVQSCENGQPKTCVPGEPKPETCNLIDDDCDGQTDEELGTISCGVGECATATAACVDGKNSVCAPNMPTSEICDGKDNDCNGTVDNGDPGGGLACNTGLNGVCSVGTTSCTSGMIQCNQTTQPSSETCNNIDDDCDGTKDENLGSTTCGVGACMVTQQNCVDGQTKTCIPKPAGIETCNSIDDDCDGTKDDNLGSTTCGVGACMVTQQNCVDGQTKTCIPKPAGIETCNNIDDDCDGVVDDGVKITYYRDVDGDGYGNPGQTIQACSPPAGYVTNSSDCNDNNAAIKPGATDLPDDSFVDANCDGIDGTEASAIFVATSGNDATQGTKTAPVATITKAIALAVNSPNRKQIYVSSGLYSGRVTLANGVSIYGGYSYTAPIPWTRATSNIAIIESATPFNGRMIAVEGYNITSPTTIDRLTVRTGATSVAGGSNYAMYLNGCSALTLKNSKLQAGAAGPGAVGANGVSGQSGVAGKSGNPGHCGTQADPEYGGTGGPGGSSSCGREGGAGGQGGEDGPHAGDPGASGNSGTSGGAGGGAGNPGAAGQNGSSGTSGQNGTNGAGGSGGLPIGGFWYGGNGFAGTDGAHGNGGGGGGGGGGEHAGGWQAEGPGNGGGGGGSGGCGGIAAAPGKAGGGSFGLFVVGSTGFALLNNSITSGNGGHGGSGGSGGNGGSGGGGGAGATACTGDVGAGGNGGNGGSGGAGGHGGGGAGGPTIALVLVGTSLSVGNNVLSFGSPGLGGASLGNPGAAGTAAATASF